MLRAVTFGGKYFVRELYLNSDSSRNPELLKICSRSRAEALQFGQRTWAKRASPFPLSKFGIDKKL